MKFATRLKVVATNLSSTTLSVGTVVTLGAAATNCRTLAQVITDGTTAGDTSAIQVSDLSVPFVFDDGSNWMEAYCTITSTTQITITQIISGSNGTSAVTFAGAMPTVFNAVPGKWLRTVVASTDGVAMTDLTAVTPTGTAYDTYVMMLVDPATGTAYKATVAALKSLFAGTPAATVTGVSVSPSTASVAGAGTQTFTATVTGTNSPAQTVTWSTNAGSITTGGVFTAPAATGSAQTITITATSTVDTSKSGTATVTVAAAGSTVTGVTVSPTTASLNGAGTQTFTATVAGTNSPSQAVNWTTTAGSITTGGAFTAPAATASTQTITITATSVQDGTKSGTATVTVAAATVTSVAVSPATPSVTGGATQQFTVTVTGTNNPPQTVTWTTTAGSITTGGLFTAPASTGSAQTIAVTATSTIDGTKSGTATVTVPATVALMKDTYSLTNTNSASMLPSTTTASTSSPDYYATPTSNVRVNVRDVNGVTLNPARVKLVFGLFSDSNCPLTTFAPTALPQGANGTTTSGGHNNGIAVGTALGGWSYSGATSQSNYGTMTPGTAFYAWFGTGSPLSGLTSGQTVDMKLWVVYDDNSAKAHDNNTGTPIKFTFTVP